MALPLFPFDGQLCIGTVIEVAPSYAKANLPQAAFPDEQWHFGSRRGKGEVGDFVLVEVGGVAVFGRLVNVRLPEKDRLTVEPSFEPKRESHPVGTIQLLSSISLATGEVRGGISRHPQLGSRVFAVHPRLVRWIAEASGKGTELSPGGTLDVAEVTAAGGTKLQLRPERLFGRHCAVLGATGGGKSWTVARLVEQASKMPRSKVVVLDATGEFHTQKGPVRHVHFGGNASTTNSSTEVVFPYSELTEGDLFALFKPSGQTQAPKLRSAMKTLKIAKCEPTLANARGLVLKANRPKDPFNKAYSANSAMVNGSQATFNMEALSFQILEECVFPIGKKQNGQVDDPTCWGKANDTERSYCIPLVTRIEDMLNSADLTPLLRPGSAESVSNAITEFLADTSLRTLCISLRNLAFSNNAREIVANAIGRHLLACARDGLFRDCPLVVFLDEAHQFLDKQLGDENSRFPLDAFDLIAKEGRKYGLTICIATQRPRDVPEGVLSQMGTLIVHRLINDRDREVVERASGEIDRSASEFLPTLAPGQAVIIGVDFPIPLTVQMGRPESLPDSRGPDFQSNWGPSLIPPGSPDVEPKYKVAGREAGGGQQLTGTDSSGD